MKRWRPRAMPTQILPAMPGERFLMFVQVVAHRRTVALDPARYTWPVPGEPPALWLKVTDKPPRPRAFVNRETGDVYWWDAGDLGGYLRACDLAGSTLDP